MTFSLESSHILCSPACYFMDGGEGGSEPLWAHNIVREIGVRAKSVTAVTGYTVRPHLGSNVRVVEVGGKPGDNFLAASVAARFTLQAGFAALRELRRQPPALFHHILPFGLGQTFNPAQWFLGKTPLVIGPVQGESYRAHFEQISLGGVSTKQGAKTRAPLSNRIANAVSPVLASLNRALIRRADAVVAISEEAASFLQHTIAQEKIHVIPPGVDTALFTARQPRDAGPVRLLTAGYLLKRKRMDVILQAFRLLLDRGVDVTLTIAGDGPEREALKSLAGELSLGNAVTWLGFVPNVEMPSIYRNADIALSASEHEGLPTAYLEAFAAGLPLVATNNQGARAVLTAQERGRIVPLYDHEAMAQAIAELAASRDALEASSRAVRSVAETVYDWSVIGERYADVYRRAAEHHIRS